MAIRDLWAVYRMPDLGIEVKALRGIDLDLEMGEILGLVGKSGSGKSMLAHAVMRILKPPARLMSSKAIFDGVDILSLDLSFDGEYGAARPSGPSIREEEERALAAQKALTFSPGRGPPPYTRPKDTSKFHRTLAALSLHLARSFASGMLSHISSANINRLWMRL